MRVFKPTEIEGTTEYSGLVKFIVNDSPDYSIGDFLIKKGDALGPESHANDETFYVIKGTVLVDDIANNRTFTVHEGEIFVMSAGEEHRAHTDTEAFVLWFQGKK